KSRNAKIRERIFAGYNEKEESAPLLAPRWTRAGYKGRLKNAIKKACDLDKPDNANKLNQPIQDEADNLAQPVQVEADNLAQPVQVEADNLAQPVQVEADNLAQPVQVEADNLAQPGLRVEAADNLAQPGLRVEAADNLAQPGLRVEAADNLAQPGLRVEAADNLDQSGLRVEADNLGMDDNLDSQDTMVIAGSQSGLESKIDALSILQLAYSNEYMSDVGKEEEEVEEIVILTSSNPDVHDNINNNCS